MTTEVRIVVPQDVMEILRFEQERRKETNGRKTAISDIMLEYCCQWMKHKDSIQEVTEVPDISGQENYNMVLHKQIPTTTELMLKEKKLLQKESELREREIYLSRRQSEMNDDKMEFYDRKEDLIRIKEESLEYMNNAREEAFKSAEIGILYKISQKEIIEKNDLIYKKDKEIDSLKKDVIKSLKIIQDNTKKNFLKDYILPALPTVVNAIGLLIINNKITKIEELKPIIADMSENIKSGNLGDISDLEKTIENKLKNEVRIQVKKEVVDNAAPSGGYVS